MRNDIRDITAGERGSKLRSIAFVGGSFEYDLNTRMRRFEGLDLVAIRSQLWRTVTQLPPSARPRFSK
jgi:hypothetical protein